MRVCIFCGVVSILIFQQKFFEFDQVQKNTKSEELPLNNKVSDEITLEGEEQLNNNVNEEVAEIVAEDQQFRLTEEPEKDISADTSEIKNHNQ